MDKNLTDATETAVEKLNPQNKTAIVVAAVTAVGVVAAIVLKKRFSKDVPVAEIESTPSDN